MEHDLSFLDLINICDNVRVHQQSPLPSSFDSEILVPLYLTESLKSPIVGLLRPVIVEQLKVENARSRDNGQQELWKFSGDGITPEQRSRVAFQTWLNTPAKRTAAMRALCERWRDTRLFDDVCGPKKWRNEMYPIYADPFGAHDHPDSAAPGTNLNLMFEMERSACALFGVVTYGVHMNIYEEDEVDGQRTLRVWVSTRSRTKQTYVLWLFAFITTTDVSFTDGPGIWTTLSRGEFRAVCRYLNLS
jgi:hypothetical protein